ncbi:DciA family protein [Streptomyces sp. NPDC004244]
MTETINYTQQDQERPVAVDAELSGADLARVALHQAREAAKTRGTSDGTRKVKRATRTTSVRRDGREPAGFCAVLQGLLADRAWNMPTIGGGILDQWPDIADAVTANLSAHVTAAAFDAERGQLDLRPDSPAYATQLRLLSTRIIAAANDATGTQAVRTIRVLAPGTTASPNTPPPATAPTTACSTATVPQQRREKPAGYHEAIANHRAHRFTPPLNPHIARARQEQIRNRTLEPEDAFAEGVAEAERQREQAARQQAQASTEARALARARAEKAGLTQLPAWPVPAPATERGPLDECG